MIIDAHYHLEERMEPVSEIISRMESNNIDRIALMASPCDPFHLGIVAEKLSGVVRKMLAGRFNKACLPLYNNTVTDDGMFSILGKKYSICHNPDNESVASVIKKYPDKFFGWIFINPVNGDPLEEINKRIEEKSWIGVKTHPFWHNYPVKILDDTAALCSEKKMPMLIHLGGNSDNGDYKYLPERHPGLKVIYAHGGVPFFRDMWKYCRKKSNVFLDLSSPYLNEHLRLKAVLETGPEKCIHGTDGPFGYPAKDGYYDHGAILSEILRLPVSEKTKEMILCKNFLGIARV